MPFNGDDEGLQGVDAIRYVDIQTENLSDNTFVNNTIEFSVAKATLQNLPNADANDVELYQYNGAEYEPLSTPAPTDDGQDFRYTASYTDINRDLMIAVDEPSISLETPSSPSVGETVTNGTTVDISVDVTNTGNKNGSIALTLSRNGMVEETRSVDIAAGQTQTETFNLTLTELGQQEFSINGESAGSVTVEHPDIDPGNLPGNGTSGDPYKISNASELQAVEDDLDANYELVSDIDASQTAQWNSRSGFDPVGTFRGSINGNGYIISQLTIKRSDKNPVEESTVGLFKSNKGTLADISLTNITVIGEAAVGGLVGENNGGTIRNARVFGDVTSTRGAVGGLAATNSGVIQNVETSGDVTDVDPTDAPSSTFVGGIVGVAESNSTIQNATSSSNVKGSTVDRGGNKVGGLVGQNSGVIRETFAAGSVSRGADSTIGGLVGDNEDSLDNTGTIEDSYFDKQKTGLDKRHPLALRHP